MQALLLQDWITIRGDASAGVTSITQATDDWVDLAEFQDVVMWLEVKEVTHGGASTVNMTYETGVSKDADMFRQCSDVTPVMGAGNVYVTVTVAATSTNLLSRWLRWTITASGATSAWDATFRIWLAVNYVGRSSTAAADQAAADAYVPYGCDC